MTQAVLADLVTAEIYRATGQEILITAKAISDWECGWYTWPSAVGRRPSAVGRRPTLGGRCVMYSRSLTQQSSGFTSAVSAPDRRRSRSRFSI
jgi:F0F1-type ATP synthase beta subunit